MTWFYADWSWLQELIAAVTTVAVVLSIMVASIASLRPHGDRRPRNRLVVTRGFADVTKRPPRAA